MISADLMMHDMELISLSLLDNRSIPRAGVQRARRENLNCLCCRSLDRAVFRNIQLSKNLSLCEHHVQVENLLVDERPVQAEHQEEAWHLLGNAYGIPLKRRSVNVAYRYV
jgi:hypothetical protein